MRYLLHIFFILSLLIIPTSAFCASQGLSFQKARKMMKERSDLLEAANANVESKQETVNSQKTLWGPTVSLQAVEIWGETHVDIDRKVNTPLGSMPIKIDEQKNFSGPRVAATATWPLFTGGKILAEKKSGEFARDEAVAQKNTVNVELDAKLIGQYFGLQLARSIEAVRKEMLDQETREVSRAKKFEAEGMISKVERMSVEVARDKDEREWLKARDNARIAKIELSRLLHDETFSQLSTPLFVLKGDLGSMAHWVDTAVAENPHISVIEAQIQQADQGAEAAKGNWFPQIFAFGQYSFIRHYQTMIEPQWLAGVGLNLTLWDARGRLGSYRSARATLRQARATKADVINQIKADTEVAWQNTKNAIERYQLTSGNVALAKENLELKTQGFEEGLNTALDMTEARTQLAEAQVGRKIAAYDFVVNYAILHAIAGKMDDFLSSVNRKDLIVEN